MFDEADMVQREVDPPSNRWCCSGHIAPENFRRSGPDKPEEPTKFFHVTAKGVSGIYCELCLIVAHWMSKQKKEESK